MNGMFIARGPHLRSAYRLEGAHIVDICPTILYLMGLEIPRDVDGRVLQEMIDEAFVNQQTITWAAETGAEGVRDIAMTAEEEAQVLNRLRELGYTG
jgi:arylsulfatase A-like enzyme